MKGQIDKFIHASIKIRAAIVGGMLSVMLLGYYYMVFGTLGEEIDAVKEELANMRVEVAQKAAIAANLPIYEGEVQKLNVELNQALSELPDKKEIPQLLEKISDKARDAGLAVNVFKPSKEQLKNFYSEVPIQIEVEGSYHQVGTFFDEVGHLERIVNIDQISMVAPKKTDNGYSIKTSLTATSFRFLDESERPKEGAKGSSKRRKAVKKDAKKGGEE